jgi:hypothetical protein
MLTRLTPFLTILLIGESLLAPGQAIIVTVNGNSYDIELITAAYEDDPTIFAKPLNGGRMPWWEDQNLAEELSIQLAESLSPLPLPIYGPLFAHTYFSGSVVGSVLELATSGTTDFVDSSYTVPRDSLQNYAALVPAHDVPAPVPLLGVGAAFQLSRRLRRRLQERQATASVHQGGSS